MLNPVREETHYDHLTDTLTVCKTEDLSQYVDALRRERNDNGDGFTANRTMRKIGSIPMTLAHQWLVEDGFDCLDPNNAKEVKRKLNEFDKLRTVDKTL